MEIFLIVAAMIFFTFGTLLLLSPEYVIRLSKMTNKVLFNIDENVPHLRRPLGIAFLVLTIFLWYIALYP
ncbi:MAG: hypothetical protein JW800_08020 [Candidatus Omnitrophica bacterium]|nr:hypothetical protein [Candidatus Omnitrophota bacterium]